MHFLDTATMADAGGLTWSTSTQGVAQARQAISASVAPVSAPVPAQAESPASQSVPAVGQQAPSTPANAPVQAPPAVEVAPEAATPSETAPAKASTNVDASPAPLNNSNTNAPAANNGSDASSANHHTGAIAGSLLGAAAIAAAIGGLYAYRKRREAAAYNLGRQSTIGGTDFDRDAGDDEEKAMRGPPVSNLYLRPDEIETAAAGAGWGARLKRAASGLKQSNSATATLGDGGDKFTAPPRPVMMLRNGAPRAAATGAMVDGGEKADLPEDFITTLLADDEPSPFSYGHRRSSSLGFGRGELLHPGYGNGDGEDLKVLHSNISRSSLATIDSHGGASHFSYPYLSNGVQAFHPQHQVENVSQNVRVILGSPTDSVMHAMHISMSPGDVVSPYHMPRNPHASPESIFLDEEEMETDTAIAQDGVSVFAMAPHQPAPQTPMFPWSTPVIAAPAPAKININGIRGAGLRVTNAS